MCVCVWGGGLCPAVCFGETELLSAAPWALRGGPPYFWNIFFRGALRSSAFQLRFLFDGIVRT